MITEQDKEDILNDPVAWIKTNKLHGKVTQNCHDGDIPSVDLHIHIIKKTNPAKGKES